MHSFNQNTRLQQQAIWEYEKSVNHEVWTALLTERLKKTKIFDNQII